MKVILSVYRYLRSVCAAAVFTATLFTVPEVRADFAVTSPSGSATVIASCTDFATAVLNNPWDMDDESDINNFLPTADFVNFGSKSFSGGIFSGVTTSTDGYFHLLSPPLGSSQPSGGRHGGDFPIDTTVYNKLSFRMYSSVASELQIVWNTGEDYFPGFVITDPIPTSAGWNVYTIDMNAVTISSSSGVSQTWSSAPATGLRIDPTTQSGVEIRFDWVSLYGSGGCGTTNATVNATANGAATRFSAYLDTDSDPFNGFVSQLATNQAASGAQSLSVGAAGLYHGDYTVSGFISADYATLARTDPWDFDESSDVIVTSNIGNATFSGGALSGTMSTSGGVIFLKIPSSGIDASVFSKLSLKISRSASYPLSIIWSSGGSTYQEIIDPLITPPVGDVFQIDMSAFSGWTGTVTSLVINPSTLAGPTFSLDFVSLRTSGYVTELSDPSVETGSAPVRVNEAPLMQIIDPDAKGGEGFTPWNMSTIEDIALITNLAVAEILPFSSVEGRSGDFFHGRNIEGNDDPINWSRFFTIARAGINADKFTRLSYALNIPGDVDIVLGSVARVYWYYEDNSYSQSADIVVYEGWNEYVLDLKNIRLEDTTIPWGGTIDSFRIDSHEFMAARDYYFDYIHLRADDTADGQFTITYDFSDADHDDDDLTLSLYYNTSKSTSGGTLITSFTPNSDATKGLYLWNTSGLAEGTYYVYGVLSDGFNSVTRLASGPLKVSRSFVDSTAPVLSVVAPTEGGTFDTQLQVKGYSLDAIQLAEIRVYIDSDLQTRIRPQNFDPLARTAYPALIDSSNAGFNVLLDTSAVSNGAHTVELVAVDTSGNETTLTFAMTKQPGGNATVVADATPTEESLAVPPRGGEPSTPKFRSLKVSKSGKLTVQISQLTEGCSLSLKAGKKSNAVTDELTQSLGVNATELASGAKFMATSLNKAPATLFVRAVVDCGVQGSKNSSVRKIKIGKGKGSYTKALRRLKTRISRTTRP